MVQCFTTYVGQAVIELHGGDGVQGAAGRRDGEYLKESGGKSFGYEKTMARVRILSNFLKTKVLNLKSKKAKEQLSTGAYVKQILE